MIAPSAAGGPFESPAAASPPGRGGAASGPRNAMLGRALFASAAWNSDPR